MGNTLYFYIFKDNKLDILECERIGINKYRYIEDYYKIKDQKGELLFDQN